MKKIKPFMKNKCDKGNCKNTKCVDCPRYNPYFFGIKVPKKLANILYAIENWLINYEFPEVFY